MIFDNDLRESGNAGGWIGPFRVPACDRRVMAGLLSVDAILILLHMMLGALSMAGIIAGVPDSLRIDRDWSLGETLNYGKWIALAVLALLMFWRQGHVIFLAIAILVAVALLDDSLQLHERLGPRLARAIAPGLELSQSVAEMIFMAVEGAIAGGPLILGWLKASPAVRRQVVPLLFLGAGAAFCASIVDFLHAQVASHVFVESVFGVIEDGGEMIFLSLMVSYAAALCRSLWAVPARGVIATGAAPARPPSPDP